LLAAQDVVAPAPAAMLLGIKGIGSEFAAILWSEGPFRHFDNRRQIASYNYAAWPRHPGRADRSIANRVYLKQAIHDCERRSSNSPGYGYAISRNRRWLCGLKNASDAIAAVLY
jgi:transposase